MGGVLGGVAGGVSGWLKNVKNVRNGGQPGDIWGFRKPGGTGGLGEGQFAEFPSGNVRDGSGKLINTANAGAAKEVSIEVLAFDAKTGITQYVAQYGEHSVDILVESVKKVDGKLILNSLDIQGSSAGKVGVKGLYAIARQLGRDQGVSQVIINGNIRSSGKFAGMFPSQVIINVK